MYYDFLDQRTGKHLELCDDRVFFDPEREEEDELDSVAIGLRRDPEDHEVISAVKDRFRKANLFD